MAATRDGREAQGLPKVQVTELASGEALREEGLTMAHQPGWIELYGCLEEGRTPSSELLEQCKGSRTGIGETMLHWYAIEGDPGVLKKLIEIGFSVNVQNEFGQTPLMEAAQIGRWDNVRVLLASGADLSMKNQDDCDFFEFMEQYGKEIPGWIKRHH